MLNKSLRRLETENPMNNGKIKKMKKHNLLSE